MASLRARSRYAFKLLGSPANLNLTLDDLRGVQPLSRPDAWYKAQVPIFTAAMGPYTTVYWFAPFRADRLTNFGAKYGAYFSTDHGNATGRPGGGIALAKANDLLGPWTNFGEVFVDNATSAAAGTGETETPSPMWDEQLGNLRVFYQQNGAKWAGAGAADSTAAFGSQSTLAFTTTDGITCVKDQNFIVDIESANSQHGDGHYGYFTPFVTRKGIRAYSLAGGSNGADFGIHRCNGALNDWITERVALGFSIEHLQTPIVRHTGWNCSSIVEHQHVEQWLGRTSDFISGTNAADCRIAVAPIDPSDYRALAGKPVTIWNPTLSFESADMRSVWTIKDENVIYTFYTIAKTSVGVLIHAL